MKKLRTLFCGTSLLLLALAATACQETPVANSNANTTNSNVASTSYNSNANVANTNSAVADAGPMIEAREPEQYRATIVFSAEATGQQRSTKLPSLSVDVERNGVDHRLTFKLPTGQEFIYLDRADKRYVVLPSSREYGELNRETTGFDVPRMMMPSQLIAQLQKRRGVEQVGEEQINGRTAIKYRYASTARTGTQAGDVQTETFTFVDKETGLPLRFDLTAGSSGNVQGVSGAKLVGEMRNLTTTIDPARFELPQDYRQISPEEVRRRVEGFTAFAAQMLQLFSSMSTQNPPTAPAAASPTPFATATPQ